MRGEVAGRARSCILPELAPFEAASPHFSCFLLPPPAVLSGYRVHPPAAADVCSVTVSDGSLPGVTPVVNMDRRPFHHFILSKISISKFSFNLLLLCLLYEHTLVNQGSIYNLQHMM